MGNFVPSSHTELYTDLCSSDLPAKSFKRLNTFSGQKIEMITVKFTGF